ALRAGVRRTRLQQLRHLPTAASQHGQPGAVQLRLRRCQSVATCFLNWKSSALSIPWLTLADVFFTAAFGARDRGHGGLKASPRALFTVLARRKIARIDRLPEERIPVVGPELADIRIGLDHRIPELVLVVAEHFLLLDFLDVDVLDRREPVVE